MLVRSVLVLVVVSGLTSSPAMADVGREPLPPTKLALRYYMPLAEANQSALRGHGWLPPPGQVQTHVLQDNDNLAELALELGRDQDVLACVTPSGTSPLSELRPGQTIVIPSPQYICHTVQPDETLAQIAARYQVSVHVIVETPWNDLQDSGATLAPGHRLLIFGGVRPATTGPRAIPVAATPSAGPQPLPASAEARQDTEPWPYGDGHFVWPVPGTLSQNFHLRHKGLDIAAEFGLAVVAADTGIVQKAGWSTTGYGNRIIIDHNIDFVTLYAHLSEVLVEEGQVVEKGQVIGTVGSTGNSTGPHVHFEIRDFGYLIDPLTVLP